ncbi:MAG: hypothetical protein J6386_16880 [Candidatus Synoicihabitans palmerolidicus]|nr:hypothetical protein [Candidatus Synoicihabitans palmerolidicus]
MLAFEDNDYAPPVDGLERLVRPLQDVGLAATSGYRWMVAPDGEPWSCSVHVAMNLSMYASFRAFNSLGESAVWGGAYEMRSQDFEDLEIEALWRTTISDDMTLSDVLAKRGKRTLLVPGLLVETQSEVDHWGQPVAWYGRQLYNVRAYAFGRCSSAEVICWRRFAWDGQ